MRLFVLLLLIINSVACSQSTAGLTIPARQIFVLGEYMDTGYRASITNRGRQTVTVDLVDKADNRTLQTVRIAPGEVRKLSVPADRRVQMTNDGTTDAELLVKMNKSVEGMRLQTLDAGRTPKDMAKVNRPERALSSTRFSSDIAPGACYVIGEGAEERYEATVRASGQTVKLRVVDGGTDRWVRGFGLGAGSRETITVGAGEVLYLCNEVTATLGVRVQTSVPVPGGRLVNAAQ